MVNKPACLLCLFVSFFFLTRWGHFFSSKSYKKSSKKMLPFKVYFSGNNSGIFWPKCRLAVKQSTKDNWDFLMSKFWRLHWKLKRSVSAPKCQFSPAGQSLIQPFLEPFQRNLGRKSYIKRLFQPRVGPRGGYSRKFWIGVCREGSWTLTLFKD